jgi:signal transduction histidine kinase
LYCLILQGDANKIRQILGNLLDNAHVFSFEHIQSRIFRFLTVFFSDDHDDFLFRLKFTDDGSVRIELVGTDRQRFDDEVGFRVFNCLRMFSTTHIFRAKSVSFLISISDQACCNAGRPGNH